MYMAHQEIRKNYYYFVPLQTIKGVLMTKVHYSTHLEVCCMQGGGGEGCVCMVGGEVRGVMCDLVGSVPVEVKSAMCESVILTTYLPLSCSLSE